MNEINEKRFSVGFHLILGVLIGIFSFFYPGFAGIVGLIVLIIAGFFTEKIVTKDHKGIRWWFSNGIIIYAFLWIITWTLIFNL